MDSKRIKEIEEMLSEITDEDANYFKQQRDRAAFYMKAPQIVRELLEENKKLRENLNSAAVALKQFADRDNYYGVSSQWSGKRHPADFAQDVLNQFGVENPDE